MSSVLIASLHKEEVVLLEELRGSTLFRRYEEIRRLLALYDVPRPVGADLDAMLAAMEAKPPTEHRAATLEILESVGLQMRRADVA